MTLRSDRRRSSVVAVPSAADEPQPYIPQWLRAADDHVLPVSPRRLKGTLSYALDPWYRVPKALLILMARGVRGCKRECCFTIEGAKRVVDTVYGFRKAVHYEKGVALALGTGDAYRAQERHIRAMGSRSGLLWIAGVSLAILGLWLGFYHPYGGSAAGIGLAAMLDAIGRRGRAPEVKPAKKAEALHPGMPTSVLWGQIKAFLEEEGLDHTITISAVRPDPWTDAFHVDLTTFYEIDAKFLESLKKRIFVPTEGGIQLRPGQTSAHKTLTILSKKPLAHVPELPWIPAGQLSAWQPLPLGESANPDTPYELIFVGQHIGIIGTTGAGKTSVHMNNAIDRLAACRDVVQWAGTLDKKDNFDAWGSVLSMTAYTVMDIDRMLDLAIAEMYRRSDVLSKLTMRARQLDDPSLRQAEWSPDLGPALVIWFDEFAQMSAWDGTKVDDQQNKPNLLFKVERLMRGGRSLGISVCLGYQATGNNDTGASIISKLATVKIVGPCSEADTLAIFTKKKRDDGYTPHHLQPGKIGGSYNDAGMAVIDGAGFGPDYVRGGFPFNALARSMRREKEWQAMGNRPMLPIESHMSPQIVMDAELVPPGLDIIDKALKHYKADKLAGETIVKYATEHNELDPKGQPWTQSSLSTALKAEIPGNEKGKVFNARNGYCPVLQMVRKCYYRDEVDKTMKILEA